MSVQVLLYPRKLCWLGANCLDIVPASNLGVQILSYSANCVCVEYTVSTLFLHEFVRFVSSIS